MENILDRRLVLVMGKGGTGKTTITRRARRLAAARRGRRTVVVEVAEQRRLLGLFGQGARDHDEVQLDRNLFGLSIDPQRAMEEWLRHHVALGDARGPARREPHLPAADRRGARSASS